MSTVRENLGNGLVLEYDTRTSGDVLDRVREAAEQEATDERAPHEGAKAQSAPQTPAMQAATADQVAVQPAERVDAAERHSEDVEQNKVRRDRFDDGLNRNDDGSEDKRREDERVDDEGNNVGGLYATDNSDGKRDIGEQVGERGNLEF
jgi:hypothetical protein